MLEEVARDNGQQRWEDEAMGITFISNMAGGDNIK